MTAGITAGHEVRESGDMLALSTTRRVGMARHDGGWQSEGVLIIVMGRRRI
jgi:hypothetical protein